MTIPARFHKHRDRVLSGVDNLFAEKVLIAFIKDGEKDPTRKNVEVEAVLRVGTSETNNLKGGSGDSWQSRISANKAELHIDPRNAPEDDICVGDRVRAITRRGAPWFEVLTPATRSHTRLIYNLGVA